MKNHTTTIKNNESGFASIIVALIMIIVLGLTTIGFAKLSRNEQQNALDKQLATQAKYAAESGINDAYYDIQQGNITTDGAGGTSQAKSSSCMSPTAPAKTSNPSVNAANGASYSCLLVDLTQTELEWQPVDPNTDRTLSFTASGLNNLKIHWGSHVPAGKSPRATGDKTFARNMDWNSPAVIQFTVVPIVGNSVTTDQQSFTAYLYPSRGGGGATPNTVNYNVNDQGAIISGQCSSATDCNATIANLNSTGAGTFLIHIMNYYDTSDITVSGNNGTAKFINGQATIDVTGRARNVLKRLQVRLPIKQLSSSTPSQGRANNALEAQAICKRIETTRLFTAFSAPSGEPAAARLCKLDLVD